MFVAVGHDGGNSLLFAYKQSNEHQKINLKLCGRCAITVCLCAGCVGCKVNVTRLLILNSVNDQVRIAISIPSMDSRNSAIALNGLFSVAPYNAVRFQYIYLNVYISFLSTLHACLPLMVAYTHTHGIYFCFMQVYIQRSGKLVHSPPFLS